MNKQTLALTDEQFQKIISTMKEGFVCADGHIVKPNIRIATALILEANLGFYKMEMGNVFLGTKDEIIVIDPMNEYFDIAHTYNGTVVNMSTYTDNY